MSAPAAWTLTGAVVISAPAAAGAVTAAPGAAVTIGASGSLTTSGDFNDDGASLTVSGGSLSVGGNWNEKLSQAGLLTAAAVTVAGDYVQGGGFADTFVHSTLNVKGALRLAGTYAYVTFVDSVAAVNGGIVEQAYSSSVLVDGGTVTAGSISAANAAIYATYQVTAGQLLVSGDDSVAAGDDFYAGGAGRIAIAGTTALGSVYAQAYQNGAIQLAHVASPADGCDTFSVSGSASIEIGAAGGARAGSFTLDTGVSITEGASIAAPHVVLAAGSVLRTGAGQRETINAVYDAASRGYRGDISGSGTLEVDPGGRMDIRDAVAASVGIRLIGTGDTVELFNPAGCSGVEIGGFAAGDAVAFAGAWSLLGFAENAAGTAGTLTLASGAARVGLEFAGAFAAGSFHVATGATTEITHA